MKTFVNFLFAMFFIVQTSMAGTVKELTFSGGAPLNEYQPSVIVPILTEAFKRNGIRFNAEYRPSLRSLMMSNSGETDGELHRVYNFHKVSGGKYSNLIRIESKLLSVWLVAFASQKVEIETWNDLKGYKVGYYRGRKNVEKKLNTVLPPEQILTATTDEEAFRMLASGIIDIVISERLQGRKFIVGNPELSNIVEIASFDETKIYAYFHKKHKEIAPAIAKTIEEMKQDGTFSIIFDNINETFQ